MGLFGKLKENFNHGGIKVQLQAPASVSMNDATVPVTVSVTATSEQHTIERVSVTITAQSYNQAFSESGNNNNSAQNQQHTVAESDYSQPFTLASGETKTVEVNIVMNQGAAVAAQLPEGSGIAQVAGMFQKLQSVSEAMNGNSYQYFVEASAKIEGVTFGPSYQQPIQILKPGEIGGAIQKNIRL